MVLLDVGSPMPSRSTDSVVGAYAYLDYIKELDRRQALYDAAAVLETSHPCAAKRW